MSLAHGTKFGVDEVAGTRGASGMGEVYRGRRPARSIRSRRIATIAAVQMQVVLSWFEDLKARAPVK